MRIISLALGLAALGLTTLPARATVNISFHPARNITGDADILNNGTAFGAYAFGNTVANAVMVNGVKFVVGVTQTGGGGTGTLTTPDGHVVVSGDAGTVSLGSDSAPFSSLSAAYHNLLAGYVYNNTGGKSLAFAISGLTPGHTYLAEIFLNVSGFGFSDTGTIGTTAFSPNSAGVAGGIGQYAVGTFKADTSGAATFTETAGQAAVANALSIRDLGAAPSPRDMDLAAARVLPDVAPPPATTIPSDQNAKAHPNWFQECRDRVAAMQGKRVDIIFIGDSITQNWVEMTSGGWNEVGGTVWPQWYANRNTLDFGVGADRTQDVLWRLDTMNIKAFRPKVDVILIGTNNTGDTPVDIAAGVRAVVHKALVTFPGSKVILMSILPNARANDKMMAANKLIQPIADNKHVFYFDLASLMTPVGDNWKGIGADHLHLTPEGYQLWASSMEPLLDRLLAARPTK